MLQYVQETIFFQGFPKEHRFEEKLERRAFLLPVPICQDPKKGVRGGGERKGRLRRFQLFLESLRPDSCCNNISNTDAKCFFLLISRPF